MIPASGDFIRAMSSSIKKQRVKLEIYDNQMNYIREITQNVIRDSIGQISVELDRPIRRSFSFSLDNSKGLFGWGAEKLIWIDKRVKLYIGLELYDGQIEYVPQGTFILVDPEDTNNLEGKRVNITGQDLAYLLTDKRGKFVNETTLSEGLNIATAIRIIAEGGGIAQFNFDVIDKTIPYEIVYGATDSRWSAIEELAKLAQCDVFFDVHGRLRLKAIDLNSFQSEPPVWSFKYGDKNEKFYAGNVRKMDSTNLANHVVVLGGSSQTATARAEIIVTESNQLWKDSPYSIEKLGYTTYFHNNGSPDPIITTNDEAFWRAKYELMNRMGYTERVSLNLSPHYLLEAGDIIEIVDSENGLEGKYLITSFSVPINPELMTVNCYKQNQVINDWNFI